MALVGEPTRQCNVGQRECRSGEERLRFVDTTREQPLMRRASCRLTEGADKMSYRKSAFTGQLREGHPALQSDGYHFLDAPLLPSRQFSAGASSAGALNITISVERVGAYSIEN